MIAFHGKQEVKDFYLSRAKSHFAADEIIQGKYWENGKGCAVGCLIHSDSHSELAAELNIPIEMAYLIDRLFEGLGNGNAKSFPVRFIEAIPVGAELDAVMDQYFLALLSDKEQGSILSANESVREPIETIIALFTRQLSGDAPSVEEWSAAYRAAYRAAYSAAYSAADRAAYRAVECAAYSAAYRAAYRAAYSAAYRAAYRAVDSAAYRAVYSAADCAAYRAVDCAADCAAREAHFIWQSELLLNLLANAPVPVEKSCARYL